MWAVSVVCLGITMVLCVVGTFSCRYDDNIFQRIGMAMLFIGCYPRLREAWETHYVTEGVWMAHIGLASFAVGTAFKVWKHRHENRPDLPELSRDEWRHVHGGLKE